MLHAAFAGAAKRLTLERKNMLWAAWTGAALERSKKMPSLQSMLEKLEPKARRVMSAKEIRAEVFAMAKAMGAKVIRKKRRN